MLLSIKNKQNRGFSIVELIIALGLYTLVLTISMGALLTMLNASKKTQNLRTALDGISVAAEDMTRTIREGTLYHCDPATTVSVDVNGLNLSNTCALGFSATAVAFEGVNGATTTPTDQIVYRLDTVNNNIEKSLDGWSTTASDWFDITGPSVNITDLRFYVVAGPLDQPRVFMSLRGETDGNDSQKISFTFQTTITQRTPLYFDP